MLSILAEKIHDGRELRLIDRMLKAGYLRTGTGTQRFPVRRKAAWPSPVLSNIYLDRFDQYIEQRLLPEYNLGDRRRRNRAYQEGFRHWASTRTVSNASRQ